MVTIGIIPLFDEEKDSYWLVPDYMKMLEQQGGIPLMLPLTTNPTVLDYFLSICDGFLLTGGHDVSPSLYGEETSLLCGDICEMRDEMETYLLKQCVKKDKSVLGICRGIQLMNACYEGTLYQDLPSEYESSVEHHMTPPYDRAAHMVTIQKPSMLYDLFQTETIGVNSYHHQAIKTLSPFFSEMARSEDGLIEAISMPGKKFIVGVQWHPEFFYKKDSCCQLLVKAFVESMRD